MNNFLGFVVVVHTIIILVMAAWIVSLHARMDDFLESMLEEEE
jgi:uncharacterized membrane protein YdbT with pleckstrin-like domain